MNIYDFMMIFAFLLGIVIILVKVWDLMQTGNIFSSWFNIGEYGHIFDIKMALLTFSIIMICHFIVFTTFMIQPERTIFMVFFRIFNYLSAINIILTVGEIMYSIVRIPPNPQRQAYQRKTA